MTGRLLFLVPARGGSVRLPGKNLLPVGGIPLVGRAIRTARLAAATLGQPDAIVACSTDDPAIATAARAWHAEVIDRPARLATADATSVDVALHALEAVAASGADVRALILVQPTGPLVEPADLVEAVRRHERDGRPIVAVRDSHPAAWHVETGADGSLTRRADGPLAARLLAGSVYVIARSQVSAAHSFAPPDAEAIVIPDDRAADVDEAVDLLAAEAILGARAVRTFELDGRTIGEGVFVIAEAGVNHNGDPALAHRLIDAAADAGADCVKFQTFDPATLASAAAPTAAYQQLAGAQDDQRAMLEGLVLPADAWPALRDHAHERDLVFLSSPFDDASAELLQGLDVPAFKVASGELTNLPFLERLAGRGRPLLVSTGMAEMVEVADAVDAIALAGDPPIALFHCVSSYPARPSDANLRAIETMRRAFGVPVGWSDHTPGIELPIAATALGATLIEKHLTLDRSMSGPDHAASLEPDEFRAMVDGIRVAASARGDGVKRPVAAERPIADVARKSLHWASTLRAGELVEAAHLVAMRPGTGMPPAALAQVSGRRTARGVVAGRAVEPDDLAAGRAPEGKASASRAPEGGG
jgi:N,N'-diacetyllegionaminate synthase